MKTTNASVRRGFTLVEMLVVISIITVLAAFLVPAVYRSIVTTKESRVALELAAITKALEQYKLEYGEYPPDFSWAAAAKPNDRAARAEILINNHLSRVFRRRLSSEDLPAVNLGRTDSSFLRRLNPTNALHFWLKGFYSDPQHPLFGNPSFKLVQKGSRSPFYEFDQTRLVKGGSGMFAYEDVSAANAPGSKEAYVYGARYYPQGDDLMSPIVYYNSASYADRIEDMDQNLSDDDPDITNPAVHFARSTAGWPRPVPPPSVSSADVINQSGNTAEFAAKNKFQLIWAGFDGEYVRPDTQDTNRPGFYEAFMIDDPNTYSLYPKGGSNFKKAQRDNITSFGGGQTLGDNLPD